MLPSNSFSKLKGTHKHFWLSDTMLKKGQDLWVVGKVKMFYLKQTLEKEYFNIISETPVYCSHLAVSLVMQVLNRAKMLA